MIAGDQNIDRILGALRVPSGPEVVRVGNLPRGALGHWARRVSDAVVIARRQRVHYLDQHPEMIDLEADVVRTVLDPDEVHTSNRDASTAVPFRRQEETHDVVVVMAISDKVELLNSVITARGQRATRRARKAEASRIVWRK